MEGGHVHLSNQFRRVKVILIDTIFNNNVKIHLSPLFSYFIYYWNRIEIDTGTNFLPIPVKTDINPYPARIESDLNLPPV